MDQSLPMRRNILFRKNIPGRLINPRFFFLSLFTLFYSLGIAQQKITGKVLSGDSAIAGATVQVKSSTIATQTDAGGNFAINAPGNATLIISYVGYATQEVKVSNRNSISINLQSTTQQLGEVVVVGYGTQRKATLTGSVSTVSGSDVAKSPSPN